jgi:uncharacterized protein (DUF1501 family)
MTASRRALLVALAALLLIALMATAAFAGEGVIPIIA